MAKKRWGARIGLLAAYLGIGFLVILFFGMGGHGSFFPLPLLLSWTVIPALFGGRLLGYVSLLFIPVYLALVIYLHTVFAKAGKSRFPWVTITIHSLGAIPGLFAAGLSENHYLVLDLAAVLFSAIVAFTYLELDWLLAGGRIQPPPKGPYWDLGSP